jgi:hypothetical protein
MKIKIIRDNEKIHKNELVELAQEFYVDMVKGVVDIEKEIIALGGEWHIDANQVLIEDGSLQKNLWGFNINLDGRIEHISLINIRPLQNNRTLEVEDPSIREKMNIVIKKLVI